MRSCLLITTMNRSPLLERSLERLTEKTVPDEVLVVDDGGEDGCDAVCDRMRDRGLPIRYIYHHNPGPTICSFARNVGVKNTEADVVITSEPEIMFLSDVVCHFLSAHEEFPGRIVSAGTVYHAPRDGVTNPQECERIVGWVAPFTALYRREWLVGVGGWDEELPGSWGWDDTDLLTRLRLTGHGQLIDDNIEVLHQWHPHNQSGHQPNESHFFAKGFNEGNREHVVANRGREWGVTRAR